MKKISIFILSMAFYSPNFSYAKIIDIFKDGAETATKEAEVSGRSMENKCTIMSEAPKPAAFEEIFGKAPGIQVPNSNSAPTQFVMKRVSDTARRAGDKLKDLADFWILT